jgi:hypothetical protein
MRVSLLLLQGILRCLNGVGCTSLASFARSRAFCIPPPARLNELPKISRRRPNQLPEITWAID